MRFTSLVVFVAGCCSTCVLLAAAVAFAAKLPGVGAGAAKAGAAVSHAAR